MHYVIMYHLKSFLLFCLQTSMRGKKLSVINLTIIIFFYANSEQIIFEKQNVTMKYQDQSETNKQIIPFQDEKRRGVVIKLRNRNSLDINDTDISRSLSIS